MNFKTIFISTINQFRYGRTHFLFYALIFLFSVNVNSQTFTTVADGTWEDPSTWSGGNVPNNPIGDTEIVQVQHLVTLSTAWTNNGRIEIITPVTPTSGNTVLNIFAAGGIINNNEIEILPGASLSETVFYLSATGTIDNSGTIIGNSEDGGPTGRARFSGNFINNSGALIEIHDVGTFLSITNFEGAIVRQFDGFVQGGAFGGAFINSGEFDIQGGSFTVRNDAIITNETTGVINNSGRLSLGFFNGDLTNNGVINNSVIGEITINTDGNGSGTLDNTNGQIFNDGFIGGSGSLVLAENSLFGSGTLSGNQTPNFFSPGILDITAGDLNAIGKFLTRIENATPETGYSSIDVTDGGIALDNTILEVIFESAYVPTLGDTFTLLSSTLPITGEFTTFQFPTLPTDLDLEVVYGSDQVDLVVVEANPSVQSGDFSDPNTWLNGVPNSTDNIVIGSGTTVTVDVSVAEGQNLSVQDNAIIVIPDTSQLNITGDGATSAVVNEGMIDILGSLNIANATSGIINNSNVVVEVGGVLTINNVANFAISNNGNFTVSEMIDIDNSALGIVNIDNFIINQNAQIDLDFITDTAIVSELGSEFTNNGDVLIGRDSDMTNNIGLYGIDLFGYFENTSTGIIEIDNAGDTAILLNDDASGSSGRNPIDGTFENSGIVIVFSEQTAGIAQGDSPDQVKGKYKHKLKKRPTLNPGRTINALPSFLNQILALIRGDGIVETDLTLFNGGTMSPEGTTSEEGILIFDGDEDLQNIVLEMDVNGTTLKGTDYDLIASTGTLTIGGELVLDFDYTPQDGDLISIIEAANIVGTFSSVNLPANWTIAYNSPSQGKVSLEFDASLSLNDEEFSGIRIFKEINTDHISIAGTIKSETKMSLIDITGRLISETSLEQNTDFNELDTSNVESGTYIIKLDSQSGKTLTRKIIID